MADVTVKYKNTTIAEMSAESTKALKTNGKYCEGDIFISYKPPSNNPTTEVNHKSYDITLAKSIGWVKLLTLDADVLAHINDASFGVFLYNLEPYEYVSYAGNCFVAMNNQIAKAGSSGTPVYGYGCRNTNETTLQTGNIFYPANSTTTSTSLGGYGQFRLNGSEYYLRPHDGYIRAGTYRIIFSW